MTDDSSVMNEWLRAVTSLDATKGSEALLNLLAGLQVPGVNMDALVASQRDNLEALSASNQAALEGFQAVGKWQMKILQETMQELAAAINGLARFESPYQLAATETELARKAFATAVRQMRELAEILTDANRQAAAAILQRLPESLGEIKDVLQVPRWPGTGS